MTVNILVQDSPGSSAQFNEAVTFTAGATVFAGFRTGAATTVTCTLQPAGTTPGATFGPDNDTAAAGRIYVFIFENVPGGANTIRFDLNAAGTPQIMAGEVTNPVAGGGGASIGPSTVNALATVTNWDGGAVTTTSANAEIMGFCSGGAAVHMTQTGSYLISSVPPADPNSRIAIVHQAVTATGTYTAGVTASTAANEVSRTFAIYTASGGGTSVPLTGASIGRAVLAATLTGGTSGGSNPTRGSFGFKGGSVGSPLRSEFTAGFFGFRGGSVGTTTPGIAVTPEVLPGNGLQSTLASPILATDTTLTIQSADAANWPSTGRYRVVLWTDPLAGPWELVRVIAGQGTATLTVVRAVEAYHGTQTARAWGSGTGAAAVITRAGLLLVQQQQSLTMRLEEFLPASSATTVTVSLTPETLTMVSRGGVVQSVAAGHYTLSGSVLTFASAFSGSERVIVSYSVRG